MFLGIEIGGTKLQLGVGAGDGVLAGLWRDTVEPGNGAEGIRAAIERGVPRLLEQAGLAPATLRGVGIGFGGPVDDATGHVVKSHQIAGWDDFALADWIGHMLNLPCVLGNDADVAGLAESLHGAGQGLSPIFYITIGSGIGGGFIVDGNIYRGTGRGAAEIGHLRLFDAASQRWDILEHFASGWAIGKHADRSAMQVARAAASGDRDALQTLDGAWQHLAEAICHVLALLAPRRIVIGGGVSLMGEALLFEPLRRHVARRVFAPFADRYDIVPAALGEEVVVHGALALARDRLG